MTNKNAFFSLKDKVFDDVLLPLKESLNKADESVGAVVMADNLGKGLSITGLMLWFACYLLAWAWFVADIFLVYRGIKNDNLNKIYQALQ